MVSLMVILFRKWFLFVYMYIYIDSLKIKTYEVFENSDADLSWLLFSKKPTCFCLKGSNDTKQLLLSASRIVIPFHLVAKDLTVR